MGIQLRVWHKDEEDSCSNFLGCVFLNEKTLFDPPKGIRTTKLQYDSGVLETEQQEISGTLTVQLLISEIVKEDSMDIKWRLQVMKADKIATMDSIKCSNPCVQVFWKGPAERDGEQVHLDWTPLQMTKEKTKTSSPIYDKACDDCVFELPPVWKRPNDTYPKGRWVSRERLEINEDEQAAVRAQEREETEKKFNFAKKTPEELKQIRVNLKCSELISKSVRDELDIVTFLLTEEEMERQCMGQEDKDIRNYFLKAELIKCQPLLLQQNQYSRQFVQIMQLVQNPPAILQRVRFLMGEELRGGGMRVVSQDPANNQLLQVYSVPLLNKDDEVTFDQHMEKLFGKGCPNLMKVIQYCTVQLRDFTHTGFNAKNERAALVTCEYCDGPTLMEYLDANWFDTTNEMFRDYLKQFAAALVALHEEGLLHRNVHPGCVVVEAANGRKMMSAVVSAAVSKKVSKKQVALAEKPVMLLGDFNFLHIPRRTGCDTSYGRNDWGDVSTTPPEAMHSTISAPSIVSTAASRRGVRRGQSSGLTQGITDKSDVFAYGLCVYHYATRGLSIPSVLALPVSANITEHLRGHIPLKWGSWLHTLLNMCLQREPRLRASSQDVLTLLSGRFVNNQK